MTDDVSGMFMPEIANKEIVRGRDTSRIASLKIFILSQLDDLVARHLSSSQLQNHQNRGKSSLAFHVSILAIDERSCDPASVSHPEPRFAKLRKQDESRKSVANDA